MFSQTQWTKGTRTGLIFFTGGLLLDVWVAVWYLTMESHVLSSSQRFWLLGLFFTGITFIVIGIIQGAISRSAQKSEENLAIKASEDLARAQASTAAARIPVVVPPASAAGAPQVPVQVTPVPAQYAAPMQRN